MRCDHVDQVGHPRLASTVAGLEEDDAPEDVQKDEGQREERGGDEEVVRIAEYADRARTNRIGQNVEQRKRAAHQAET